MRLFRVYILLCFISCPSRAIDITGELLIYKTKNEETLYDIARRFDLGIDELIYANPKIDPWIPKEGSDLIIPSMHILPSKPHYGIIINKADLRLYFFLENGKLARTFPISIGTLKHETPIGITKIKQKQLNPYWIAPPSMRADNPELPKIIPPGPDNPLGKYAILLEWPNITIHSTNKPWSIGTYSSYGCIRMYSEDAELLFNEAKQNTIVRVVNEPIKLGWLNGDLYLEASPSEEQKIQIDTFGYIFINPKLSQIKSKIISKYERKKIDEEILNKTLKEYRGIPIKISK